MNGTPYPASLPYSGIDRNARDHSSRAAVHATTSAPTQRELVYAAICESPHGLTDREIQDLLGLDGSTERPRRIELYRAQRIVGCGSRVVKGRRAATVWVSTLDWENRDLDPPDEYNRQEVEE